MKASNESDSIKRLLITRCATMGFLSAYTLFLLEIITLFVGVGLVMASSKSSQRSAKKRLNIIDLSKQRLCQQRRLDKQTCPSGQLKVRRVAIKKQLKLLQQPGPRLFVLDFDGDITASAVSELREAIDALLMMVTTEDRVLVRLESGGGTVNGYGLASAQLARLREQGIFLTISVDKIAASGGYMMACVANHITASPFAIIGSIGVVAQLPNVHRWLKKHNVDVELITAGEYKRTLTLLGENTDKGRKKFTDDMQHIHQQFKEHLSKWRDVADVEQVASGEYWLAERALTLKLVDELITSDGYLERAFTQYHVFQFDQKRRRPLIKKLLQPAGQLLQKQPFIS